MITALRLVLADLRIRTGLLTAAVLLVATPLAGYLMLHGYARGLDVDFAATSPPDLIVQEANSVGEITGSRIPATVEQDLLARGVTWAIPEIHSVSGSTARNALLVRGVDPERYRAVTDFTIVSGRALAPGDPDDAVMIGRDVAESRGAAAGGTITIRSQPYPVIGVFEVGTYVDNEVWLSLAGARQLLGWGEEVSLFIVPGDGPLAEGDALPGPLAVARRGDFVAIADEWDPVFDLAGVANTALATATAIILAVILWRLAWLRRRDLAILRAVGLSRTVPVLYLATQGTLIALVGFGLGIAGALTLGAVVRIHAFGIAARAVFDGSGIVRGAVLTAVILGASVVAAAVRVMRTRPAEFLRGA